MITQEARREILENRPQITWEGEPLLGGVYGEEEIEAAVEAMRDSMAYQRGFGFQEPFTGKFEEEFAAYAGVKHAIAVNSAGPGLDMAMRYLQLQPGDEVIVPALNFVASPLAVMGAGGQVVWGEVNPRTLQLDPAEVEKRITPRTRAIFPVHMNGLSAPMDELLEIAQRHPHAEHGPLPVIGDAARACGGKYKGEPIGRKGLMTVYSFHTMKNMCTLGEGGMVATDNDEVAEFCRSTRFFGARTDIWGTSNVMTKVQGAVGRVQLRKLDGFIEARRRLAKARDEMLSGCPELELPHEPPDCTHSYYLYTCLVKKDWAGEKRDALMAAMKDGYGVKCIVANRPVYQDRKVLRDHAAGQRVPLSEELGARLFCAPIHPGMSDEDNAYICAALLETIEQLKRT